MIRVTKAAPFKIQLKELLEDELEVHQANLLDKKCTAAILRYENEK